jgi:hypothetical protein
MSGLEFLAEAKEMRPLIPVVIYTRYMTSATKAAANRLGALAYLDGLYIDELERILGIVESTRRAAEMLGPATRRWVSIVLTVARSNSDVPTIAEWSLHAGRSVGTLGAC